MSMNLEHIKNAHEGIRIFGALLVRDPAYGLLKEALKLQGSWIPFDEKLVVEVKICADDVVVSTVYKDDLQPAGKYWIPAVVFEMPTIEEGHRQANTLKMIAQARADLITANLDHAARVHELNKRITMLSRVAERRKTGENV